MITVFRTNLFDRATYTVPQGDPQRRSFKNIQVADLLRVLHDDMFVRRRVLLEMRHSLEELVVLTSVPADRLHLGKANPWTGLVDAALSLSASCRSCPELNDYKSRTRIM